MTIASRNSQFIDWLLDQLGIDERGKQRVSNLELRAPANGSVSVVIEMIPKIPKEEQEPEIQKFELVFERQLE